MKNSSNGTTIAPWPISHWRHSADRVVKQVCNTFEISVTV